jgi:hypothetical protein
MIKFALGYKGIYNINYIRNFGINSNYFNSYLKTIKNHRDLLHLPIKHENHLDIFISTYNIDNNLTNFISNELYPKKIEFLNSHFINGQSEMSQLNHYKKIIKMILDEEFESNLKYDYIILTRPDIFFHKNYKDMSINLNSFNITVEHPSKNCDDNFWVFPRVHLDDFAKCLDLLLDEHKIVHEINHKLSIFNIPIHYMETLIDSYMGHNLFEFVR